MTTVPTSQLMCESISTIREELRQLHADKTRIVELQNHYNNLLMHIDNIESNMDYRMDADARGRIHMVRSFVLRKSEVLRKQRAELEKSLPGAKTYIDVMSTMLSLQCSEQRKTECAKVDE